VPDCNEVRRVLAGRAGTPPSANALSAARPGKEARRSHWSRFCTGTATTLSTAGPAATASKCGAAVAARDRFRRQPATRAGAVSLPQLSPMSRPRGTRRLTFPIDHLRVGWPQCARSLCSPAAWARASAMATDRSLQPGTARGQSRGAFMKSGGGPTGTCAASAVGRTVASDPARRTPDLADSRPR
jgi:hypothetical protein